MAMAEISRNQNTAAVKNPSHFSDLHHQNRMVVNSNESYDLISSLPDAILQQILSSIPTKSAIRTSVLSKRWRYVWSEIPSLSIDINRSRSFTTRSINKILSSYTAPKITSFHLRTNLFDMIQSVEEWIQFAISHDVENLSLEFRDSDSRVYNIPDYFYTNLTVKQLLVNTRSVIIIPKFTVSWTSLRSLSLSFCKLSDESLVNILSGSPLLESLELRDCDQYQCLDLSELPRLRRLEIERRDWYMGPIKIVAPHIHCLKLIHSRVLCSLVDVSSLTEANLNMYYPCLGDFPRINAFKMLEKFQNVEKLTLGSTFLQMLSVEALCGVCFPTLKVESLTLETIIFRAVIPGITKVLQNSPGLRKLTIHTVKDSIIWDGRLLNQYEIFPNYIGSISMMVGKYAESKLVASFMEVLLRNTISLETMVLQLVGYLDALGFEELLAMASTLSRNNNVLIEVKQS